MPSSDYSSEVFLRVMSYMPFVIIAIGYTGNIISFIIFTFNKQMNKISSMRILAFTSLIDVLTISVWNLDHYFLPNHGYRLEYLNLSLCRILSYIQYFSMHASSLLHGFLSIDRYFTVISVPGSFASKLPFGTPKWAVIWSLSIIITIMLLNIHLLFFAGNFNYNTEFEFSNNTNITTVVESFDCNMTQGYIIALWDRISNLLLGNFLPFTIMIVFNLLLICKTFKLGQVNKMNKSVEKSKKMANASRNRLTISLLIISFLYIFMTLPATILFSFFYANLIVTPIGAAILTFSDTLLFFQHAIIFFTCYFSNNKFRSVVVEYVNHGVSKLLGRK